MTDHLPECPWADRGYAFPCICDRLRACEQRVRQEVNAPAYLCVACWHRQDGHTCERPERCMCRDCNYAAGLDAAREAVERVSSLLQPLGPALAAIDALRGES